MVSQKYRWDFIGLSTDDKPTSETSDKVVNGSTYYCSDTSKLYVYCDGTWYERKPLGGGGGGDTSNFNDLSNRPKYNGSDMTGSTNIPEVKTYTAGSNVAISDQNVISATDTTYSNFTGTDGTAAGVAGLVPAPATTDAGKFLKADGTWGTAGGGSGGVTMLTSADYDYPTANPDGVAMWLLDEGIYTPGEDVKLYASTTSSGTYGPGGAILISKNYNNTTQYVDYMSASGGSIFYETTISSGVEVSRNYNIRSNILQQTTGTSTTDVMSQNAVTRMIFADPANKTKVQIGGTANSGGTNAVAIGNDTDAISDRSVALGPSARVTNSPYSIALAYGAVENQQGVFQIGLNRYPGQATSGYNNSEYRLLTGVYDPQSAHDAATKGYVDPTTDSSAPTTATVGRLGQIQIDTTNNDAYMCVAVDDVAPAYTWKKITV